MVKGLQYAEFGVKAYEEQIKMQKLRSIHRLANELNMQLIDSQ